MSRRYGWGQIHWIHTSSMLVDQPWPSSGHQVSCSESWRQCGQIKILNFPISNYNILWCRYKSRIWWWSYFRWRDIYWRKHFRIICWRPFKRALRCFHSSIMSYGSFFICTFFNHYTCYIQGLHTLVPLVFDPGRDAKNQSLFYFIAIHII